MLSSKNGTCIFHIGLYLLCGLLIVIFVNTYPIYRFLATRLGNGISSFLPLALPVAVITICLWACSGSYARRRVHWLLLLPGIFLCLIALLIPDPAIAIKRIHVVEYLLLSLLVRYTMSHHLSGTRLLLFSGLFTAVLGVHDEFLQGIHQLRTYGLRDMLVNMVAGFGGALFWHGLGLFRQPTETTGSTEWRMHQLLYLLWLILAVFAMIVPIAAYLHHALPYWPGLPLLSTTVFWCCFGRGDRSEVGHGLTILSLACLLFLLYPVMVNMLQIPFS